MVKIFPFVFLILLLFLWGPGIEKFYQNRTEKKIDSGVKEIEPGLSFSEYPKVWQFLGRFYLVAKRENQKSGVPVSVIFAQAILESGYGESDVSKKFNNYFGIRERRGNQYFYREFEGLFDSWHFYTSVLGKERYCECFECGSLDYSCWAFCIHRKGYAEDPKYGDKLVRIIEQYKLWRLD